MGFEQSKDKDEPPSPEKEKQNKYHSAEHPQTLHNCSILQGLSESVKKKCSNYGVQVYFRGGTTIKTSWWPQRTKILW